MINFDTIRQRAKELEKEGIEPDRALAIATAEEVTRIQDEAKKDAERKVELDRVIKEGKEAVQGLKDLHENLENDLKEERNAEKKRITGAT